MLPAKNRKLRVVLLGEKRAFLPIKDLSGNGALTLEDIDVLKGG
jgi:hypothetical protein